MTCNRVPVTPELGCQRRQSPKIQFPAEVETDVSCVTDSMVGAGVHFNLYEYGEAWHSREVAPRPR